MKSHCNNPVLGLMLPRIGVGLFFLVFGLMKIMDPSSVEGMIGNLFGFSGILQTLTAWVLILAELVGGLFIILGSKVPLKLYKLSIMALIIVTIVGFITAHAGADDMIKQLLWHVMLLLVMLGLLHSRPMCPMGITGSCKI